VGSGVAVLSALVAICTRKAWCAGDGAGQGGLPACTASGGEVLDDPAGDVDGHVRAVVELDEVALPGRAAVAATPIDL